jgi:hypothetical protein
LALEIGTGQSPINEDDSRAKVKAAGLKPVRVQGNVARHLDTLAALISGIVGSKSTTEGAPLAGTSTTHFKHPHVISSRRREIPEALADKSGLSDQRSHDLAI